MSNKTSPSLKSPAETLPEEGDDLSFLDARELRCPMPSVHLRMKLDGLKPQQKLEMWGQGETARENAATLLAMLHFPPPELLANSAETGEWKILIHPKEV